MERVSPFQREFENQSFEKNPANPGNPAKALEAQAGQGPIQC
jgi:hypothetical protein